MESRPLGNTGETIPRIGQGTWKVRDHARATAAIEEGIRLGLTHIDTAELYEQGTKSETMLGPIVHKHRSKIFLASKVLPQNATARGVPSACKDSMVRLQTDQIDLYYHHWRGRPPLSETLHALADLVDKGWVRHIGVSNYDVSDLEEAVGILGKGRIVANQVLHHLEDRGAEDEVVPWCKTNGVTVVGYSPFGSGPFVRRPHAQRKLGQVADALGKTPRQVALAFLTRQTHVVTIPKAESIEHVRENAGGTFDLPKDAIEQIEQAFPVKAGLRDL